MMPEDAKKELATDGTGWLLFPREWEGLHEAFPEVPPQCDTRSPLLPTLGHLVWGAAGGVIWNAVRAIQRKPLHHAVLNGIGLVTIPLTAWKATTNEFQRQGAMQDVKAILKADNIALPKRRYVKAVSGSTADSMAVSWRRN